ncbi:AfsR/SARP family transcriptional regulator [Polymorphospora rubra]|uniref:AfsR/SARP family transcriptional regulator n=1 Tax=Polymorphospora rubra TaxID=338584 RepID=UPI0033D32758
MSTARQEDAGLLIKNDLSGVLPHRAHGSTTVKLGVLGPLTVADGCTDRTPTAPKQRQLLALLLLNANTTVPVPQLVEELWGFDPPPSAVAAIQTYVKQLRRTLPARHDPVKRSPLITRGRGYLIEVQPGELDLERFRHMVDPSHLVNDTLTIARTYSTALALWRGPVLIDVKTGPLLQTAAARLEAERFEAVIRLLAAQLNLGLHRALIAEISALTCRHPTSEALSAQLMLALYRSDRRADALAEYHRVRRTLRAEMGTTPGPALQRLNTDIIIGSPRLDPPRQIRTMLSPEHLIGFATGRTQLPSDPGVRTPGSPKSDRQLALREPTGGRSGVSTVRRAGAAD